MAKTVRIPLVGVPHTRAFGTAATRPGVATLDQKFINIAFKSEANQITGQKRVKACKRPGFGTATSIATVTGTGSPSGGALSVCTAPALVAGAGASPNAFSVWISSTADNIRVVLAGTQISNNSAVTSPIASSRPILLNVDGTPQFYFHIVTTNPTNKSAFVSSTASPPVISAQTDGDLPETLLIGSFAALDGYLFIATSDGSIWNSDLNNDTSWTSTSFLDNQFQQYGRGVANYKDKIMMFSEDSIEFYENVGNPTGSPLQRVDHLSKKGYGISANANETSQYYLPAHDTVFWLNNIRAGQAGVFMLDGFQPKKISTPDVDMDITKGSILLSNIAGTFTFNGFSYLVVSLDVTNTYVWLYCLELGTWTTLESPLFTSTVTLAGIVNDSSIGTTTAFIGTNFYLLDNDFLFSSIGYTDGGAAYTATIQTRNLDFGTRKRKRFDRLTLIGNDPQETSNCSVSWSSDDYANFSTARTLNLTDNDGAPTTTRLGAHRKLAFRITNASDAAMELEAIELDMEELQA